MLRRSFGQASGLSSVNLPLPHKVSGVLLDEVFGRLFSIEYIGS
jgi:hypothetical protein